jgi:hypothetical protein
MSALDAFASELDNFDFMEEVNQAAKIIKGGCFARFSLFFFFFFFLQAHCGTAGRGGRTG